MCSSSNIVKMPHPDVKPCPDCIIDSVGFGFVTGAIGGSAYHLLKGLYHSPNSRRIAAGAQAVRINAPCIGGTWAAYLGCVGAFRCAMVSARKKDDVWNYALPRFAAGICLPTGRGPRAVGISGLAGLSGSLLAYALHFSIGRIPVASSFPPPPVEDSGLTPPAGSPGKTQTMPIDAPGASISSLDS